MTTRQDTTSRQFRIPGAGRVRGRDLPFFCRSLAAMLNTGMALGDCLRSLESQQKNRRLRAAILWMRMDIESGAGVSDSMRQFPSLFDAPSIGMIKAAEMTGRMPETFTQIAGLLDARHKMRRRIRLMLIYPLIVFLPPVVLNDPSLQVMVGEQTRPCRFPKWAHFRQLKSRMFTGDCSAFACSVSTEKRKEA